ncbi:transcriptional regulator [Streptomyces syringium]|uniref:transcriptional regulator n=1 Tax=Streptomyces syringium TaxID=76729 RepID=UPI003D94B8D5
MTGPERRNVSLEHWVHVSGATYETVAAEVIKVARAQGCYSVQPDRSRVRRWITKGEHPRDPVPEFLAEALTRLCRLARPLTLADIGLRGRPTVGPTTSWKADAVVAAIIDTARSEALTDDSAPPTVPLLTGSQLMGAVQPWLHLPDEPLPDPIRPGCIGMNDVKAIEAATDAFRTLDSTHGGGLSRRAVVGQLHDVTLLATNGRTSDDVGRALFIAIADLASVAGWMTHDVGRHAESQHYFLLGLQAAKQAGPAGAGIAGHLLNCLSRQANHLGRAEDALELVQAAQYGTRKIPPGRLRAFLCTLEARCHAVLGHLPEATRAIGIADDALAADRSEPVPSWAAWFDDAEYQITAGVCESIAATHNPRHATRAIELIKAGTAQRPAERIRSRAFDHIALARAQVQAHQLEAADHTTATALDLLGRVNSTRVTDRLRELDTELAVTGAKAATETRERIRAAISP